MCKSLSKMLFMVILLFVFVGQTMAYHYTVSYDTSSDVHMKVQPQTVENDFDNVIDAIALENHANSNGDCCDADCCEDECACPANACTSLVYFESKFSLAEMIMLSETLLPLVTKAIHAIATRLYRPPIFTS